MAATTKVKPTPKLLTAGRFRVSWKRLVIFASLALNIGFIVLWISLSVTNSLDGLFMDPGLDRYCSTVNDDKFSTSSTQVKELRNYVCDRNDAHKYFQDGLNKYLDSKNVQHATSE